MGAYHSTKNFGILETGTNGTEISWEKFQKIRKLLSFRKANHSTENSGMKVKWNGNFQEKILREKLPSLMQIPNFLLSAS